MSALIAPEKFATANATAHVTDTDSNGEADRILILGGTSKQIALFSKSKFEFEKCDMQMEFGGRKLKIMTPTTITNTCTTCGQKFHQDCDILKQIENYICTKCKIRKKSRRGRM